MATIGFAQRKRSRESYGNVHLKPTRHDYGEKLTYTPRKTPIQFV